MTKKRTKAKSRLGRELKEEPKVYVPDEFAKFTPKIRDALINNIQTRNKAKSRLGREFPMPRSIEIAEKCVGIAPDFGVNEETLKTLSVSEKRFLQVHQEMHTVAKYMHEEKLRIKKAKFFRRLSKVLDNKLINPSTIIEYVNQYQKGE